MNIGQLLHRLETESVRVAREAMEQPSGGDVFMHGRAVGFYHGLQHVKQLIDDMLREHDRRDI